ncbi:cation:proton antiporter [Candidatus Aerophobetes bacterium]|uniref:Cation:proton antiporter n=1 Tax=Aerophobetes bacterium TaxID=2030807 RepID=A0A662DEE7_UNCAE|nr:MAG: cation:proton antiporter [Candidatus Aerophobetes bacterium]
MRKIISIIILVIIGVGFIFAFSQIPFGKDKINVANYYIEKGIKQTGAVNIVTSVVLNYRGIDTLGEITVLFIAAIGLGAVLFVERKIQKNIADNKKDKTKRASLILRTGSRLLFPLILLFGSYIFVHGHLTPGGGFQGGAVVASGFLLMYLAFPKQSINKKSSSVAESLSGLIFVGIGLLGLVFSGYFLTNFLPKGVPNTIFSAGIIPVIYIAIGFKVGFELTGIIDDLLERSK